MDFKIEIAADVTQKFPDLRVLSREVRGVKISDVDAQLEEFKEEVCADVKRRFYPRKFEGRTSVQSLQGLLLEDRHRPD